MYLFCNSDLVESTNKTEKKMTVQGNGGNLEVTHNATVTGYKQDVWFSKYVITNRIDLKLIKKHGVTYDSINQIFVVHKEDQLKKTWNSRCMNTDSIVIIQLIRQ